MREIEIVFLLGLPTIQNDAVELSGVAGPMLLIFLFIPSQLPSLPDETFGEHHRLAKN